MKTGILCLAASLAAALTFGYIANGWAADNKGLEVPLGLLPIQWPKDNPYSAERGKLARLLYFTKPTSPAGPISSPTCHTPRFAFTAGRPAPPASTDHPPHQTLPPR